MSSTEPRSMGLWPQAAGRALVIALACWVGQAAAADAPIWEQGQHFQTEGEVVPLAQDGIHDPDNPAVNVLQEPVNSMAGFPRDDAGIIDWVKVLDEGYIEPRAVRTEQGHMTTTDFDIIFKQTGSMPYVRFPHKPHTEWLTCANCHPAIFLPQKGANPITMSAIIQGDFCGVCHGKVAFPPTKNCGRCHSVPRDKAGLR